LSSYRPSFYIHFLMSLYLEFRSYFFLSFLPCVYLIICFGFILFS
jgi:hypothetical protein